MPNTKTYAIRGGLIAFALSIISGILLPITFLLCATDGTLRLNLLIPVCLAVILIKCLFAVPIGAWLGWQVGEKISADPNFRFWNHCKQLVVGFLQQRSYRVILSVIVLLTAVKCGYSIYVYLSGSK
jgi:hypothetical protein